MPPLYTHTHARAHGVQVGLACVNDGAATPKYCLKDFFSSLNRHAKRAPQKSPKIVKET